MNSAGAEDRASCQGDREQWDGEEDRQKIDRGTEFWMDVKDQATKNVAEGEKGHQGGTGEAFEAVAETEGVGDVDRKIVGAVGVPAGGAEEWVPGAEGGDFPRDSQGRAVGVAFDATGGEGGVG